MRDVIREEMTSAPNIGRSRSEEVYPVAVFLDADKIAVDVKLKRSESGCENLYAGYVCNICDFA